jgi:RNA polymerase sigma factor (sigma-70 family)
MNEMDLVREYVRTRSDAAFAELSRRYVNLVYSSALRQVGNAALAEDVTQAAFLVLARKAHRLRGDLPLSSWLLTVTRYAAKDALKAESRRKRHEQKAASMSQVMTQSLSENRGVEGGWDQVAPLLDEAVATLNRGGRAAIVLRYFEHKTYRQLADDMGVTEAAARQRVSRALEQLRTYFSGRGIVLSAVGLKAIMRSNAVAPAPHSVGSAAAHMGTGGVVITAKHAALAQAVSIAMIPLAAKWAAVAAIVVLVGAAGVLLFRHVAPSYTVTAAVSQAPAASIRGSVVTPDGKPVEGAEVLLAQRSAPAAAYGVQRDNVLSVRTGADGTYELPGRPDATAIVVRADQGYAQVHVEVVGSSGSRIVLSPWGRIEGTLRVGGKLRPDETVELVRTGSQSQDWERWHVMHEVRVKTNLLGKFVFPRVIGMPRDDPHGTAVRWTPAGKPDESRYLDVRVQPGETVKVVFGSDGATLHGRISNAGNLPPFHGVLVPVIESPATRPARPTVVRPHPITFTASADGTFQIEDVTPGHYELDLRSWIQWPGSPVGEEVAALHTRVTAPASGGSDGVVDLGVFSARLNPILRPGDPVPEFSSVVTGETDGETDLAHLRGKLVLLYVDHPEGDSTALRLSLMPVFDRFASDPRFAMLELGGGSLLDRFRNYRQRAAAPWKVVYPRPRPSTRPPDTAPAGQDVNLYYSDLRLFLIDGNGRLLTKCWGAKDAYNAIDRALAPSMATTHSAHLQVERVIDLNADRARPFQKLPNPSETDNLARAARFSIVDGVIGRYSGKLDVLHDGLLPNGNDQPISNFSFDWGTLEGRFVVDLGRVSPITRINSYSWHRTERGPQVYSVFGSDGAGPDFVAKPKIGTDPARCGWKRIADVDCRPAAKPFGGRYAVSISGAGASLGTYRYLLFEAFVTETDDDWGHTFFSEIDVIRQPEGNQ